MAAARLFGIFILILHLLQDSCGQQIGLGSKPGLGSSSSQLGGPEQALQRKGNLIANPKTFNQNIKPGNLGFNLNSQQNSQANLQQTGLQQFLSCQTPSNILSGQQPRNVQQNMNIEQSLSVQQPPNVNLHQPILNQNMQQSLPLNLQQQILQRQQMASVPLNNLQMSGQQVPNQSNDIYSGSLPIVNGKISGLPSQVSQGVLLSNLGFTSSLPSLLPNSCAYTESVDQLAAMIPQNNVVPLSNVPISPVDRMQTATLPLSISTSSLSNDNALMNNPSAFQPSSVVPTAVRNSDIQQNLLPYYSAQNSYNAMQHEPIQNQAIFNPVQTQPTYVESQQNMNLFENQPSPINSFILSQFQSSPPASSASLYNTVPCANPSKPIVNIAQPSAKSSNIKSLLPLLFNLLKEKNGCSCPYCGCMNNNQNNNNHIQDPRVFTGYSNQKTYGQGCEQTSVSNAKSDEDETSGTKPELQTYSKHENMVESEEDYEDEDTNELNDDND